jgi:hypothetical protein
MVRPRRRTGFMNKAKAIVLQSAGLTAQEVYQRLAATGEVLSAAQDPQASLVAALHKYYSKHGLERRRDASGRYHYYAKGQSQPHASVETDPTNGCNECCCITLSPDETKRIRALVDLGQYPNEHEAHRDLVKKGLAEILSRLSK